MMDTNSQPEVGVGPWPGGPEAWPADPRYDRELLAAGGLYRTLWEAQQ